MDKQDQEDQVVVLVAVDQVDREEMQVQVDREVQVDQVVMLVRVDIKDMVDLMVLKDLRDMLDQDQLVEVGLTYRLL